MHLTIAWTIDASSEKCLILITSSEIKFKLTQNKVVSLSNSLDSFCILWRLTDIYER